MQQWASAAPAAAEQEKARRESVGVLKERSSKIPRAEGDLNALLTRYLDKTIGQYEKQKGVPEPMQKMLSKMEWVVVHVLGREKDDTAGRAKIKPKLLTTFELTKAEVTKLLAVQDKAQLYADKCRRTPKPSSRT